MYAYIGSEIAKFSSQVKGIVIAYRVPLVTFSTKCGCSCPDVKMETLPVNMR